MSKDTNFSGHPVLSQIIKLINRDKVHKLATTTKVNRYVKSFDAFTHLVVMIYAALSGAKSIRQVVEGFEANVTRLNHLGISYLVRRSTLSDANKKRTSQFFGDVYKALYERYSSFLSDSKSSKALQKGLYILDSTTISLFSQILKGVGRTPKNSKKKGGIKAHTLLEASCVLPSFVDYSAAAIHDHSRMSSILSLPSGSFATFDMGYVDYWMWKQFTDHDIFFVTRQKDKMSFTVIENITCSSNDDIVSDQKISVVYRHTTERELTEEEMKHRRGRKPKKRPTVKQTETGTLVLRRVVKKTDDKKGTIAFITNNFSLSASEICEIYRRRWAIECLFKRLKQNFPLKYFLGDSVNAIEIQIWSVMIAYLLTRVISRKAKDKMSFSNLVCAIRLTMFSYIDIVAMVVDPLRAWRDLKEAQRKQALAYNPKYIQLSLFDDL